MARIFFDFSIFSILWCQTVPSDHCYWDPKMNNWHLFVVYPSACSSAAFQGLGMLLGNASSTKLFFCHEFTPLARLDFQARTLRLSLKQNKSTITVNSGLVFAFEQPHAKTYSIPKSISAFIFKFFFNQTLDYAQSSNKARYLQKAPN